MTAEDRLRTIAEVIRDRGFYAMGPTDGAALEALITQATGQPAVPFQPRPPRVVHAAPRAPRNDDLSSLARAFKKCGWRLARVP